MDMAGYRQTLNLSYPLPENSSNTTDSESCDAHDDVETAAILVGKDVEARIITSEDVFISGFDSVIVASGLSGRSSDCWDYLRLSRQEASSDSWWYPGVVQWHTPCSSYQLVVGCTWLSMYPSLGGHC